MLDVHNVIECAAKHAELADKQLQIIDFETNPLTNVHDISRDTVNTFDNLLQTKVDLHILAMKHDKLQAKFSNGIHFLNKTQIQQQIIDSLSKNITQLMKEFMLWFHNPNADNMQMLAKIHIYADAHTTCNPKTQIAVTKALCPQLIEIAAAKVFCLYVTNLEMHDAIAAYKRLFVQNQYQHAVVMQQIKDKHSTLFTLVCTKFEQIDCL